MDLTGKIGAEGSVARSAEQAASGAHDTIERMSAAARPTLDRMTTGAHRAVDRMAGMAGQAADSFSVQGQKLKDAQTRMLASSRTYVRDHPIAAVGIAVAAGFLISRIFSSRD